MAFKRITLALASAALGLTLFTPVTSELTPPAAAATVASGASLSISPKNFVGGQALIFSGNLGVRGERRIWVESHMNRPGDRWLKEGTYGGRTNADGSFRIKVLAPDMFDISYRIAGAGGYATPGRLFNAKTQEVTMWVAGRDSEDPENPGYPMVGLPFTISADTTPDLYRRADTDGLPVFQGRNLTLQRRTAPTRWETIARTTVESDGMGYFRNLTSAPGTVVYRVRMEDWTANGSRVGWQATFPTYVRVRNLGELPNPDEQGPKIPDGQPSKPAGKPSEIAASRYNWYPRLWDFSWEEGQDLDSLPKAGEKMKGRWEQYTTGAGRVSKHNGGIRIDSARLRQDGRGDFGTTRATLRNNATKYGRWEVRMRAKTAETASADYTMRLELVPERAGDYACGRHNITIAEFRGAKSGMTVGVNAGTKKWRKFVAAPSIMGTDSAYAVEVNKDHITWFLNSKPVATIKNPGAVSDVPMTLRFNLTGPTGVEHDSTSWYSDWQRGFPIYKGKQVRSGGGLTKSPLASCPD